jgi:competence protein ComEC
MRLLEVLCGAFVVHLYLQPAEVSDLSFQLSYLALLGIAAISPSAARELRPWLPQSASGALGAGLGAQAATAPLLLAVFGRVYPVGIAAGLVVGPLVSVFMIVGLVSTVLALVNVGVLTQTAGRLLATTAGAIESLARFFAGSRPVGAGAMYPIAGLSYILTLVGIFVEYRRLAWNSRT